MDYQHKEKNVPKWINVLHVISSWLPDINSISGLLFYTFVLYVIRICIKFYCAKPFDYYEEDKETVRDNIKLHFFVLEKYRVRSFEIAFIQIVVIGQ